MIDVAVIGCGPAGMSAAINAVQRNKKVTVFGKQIDTNLLYNAKEVDNYLGMPSVSGKELLDDFYNHAKAKGVEFEIGKITQILPMGEYFVLNLENTFFQAKTIILATGITRGNVLQGENEYMGKGVSYCATCDGMLYKGKDVLVIGETVEGEEDANFLSEICSKVYYVPKYNKVRNINSNVEILNEKVEKIEGNDFVGSVALKGNNIAVEGVFIIKDSIPFSSLVPGLELLDNSIKVTKDMETNIKGIFAAGDCTGKPYQVAKAVGEGLISAQQAVKYLG